MMRVFILAVAFGITLLYADGFTLTSSDFEGQLGNEQVYNGFGCKGGNISPALSWKNAPRGTKSFAVTMYDKDAPTGSGWWHWIVINIPSNVSSLRKNSGNPKLSLMPNGAEQIKTDFGTNGYGGACPPVGHGPHQYVITVYALDVKHLNIEKGASTALAGYMINAHAIEKASVISYFGR